MVDRHHPGKAPTALLQALADGSCQTIDQLEISLNLTRKQVSDAAAILLRRDYLMRMGAGCYQLTEAGLAAAVAGDVIKSGPRGPRHRPHIVRNTLRERAWRSMRIRRRFTVSDLMLDAAGVDDKSPAANLQRYLWSLSKAGYVAAAKDRVDHSSPTSNGFKLWILRKNTGPLAPVVLSKVAAVHDRNTGEDVPCTRP